MVAASLLVLVSPLTYQGAFIGTITNLPHTSPSAFSLGGLSTATSRSSSAVPVSSNSTSGSTGSSSSDSTSSIQVSTSGSSAGLKVYSDSACTSPVRSLDWGSISPGLTATTTVYVKNTGDSNSLSLSIQADNWNPTSAGSYLTLSWNKDGTVLAPGQSTEATIALTVSSSVTGITSFGVQISISGTG